MYENYIDPQLQILERCQVSWETMMASSPEDMSAYGVPGLTKFDIQKLFPSIINYFKNIRAHSNDDVSPFLLQTISQSLPSWTTPLESWMPSAPTTTPNIVSHFNAMWSGLIIFDNEQKIPDLKELNKIIAENKRLQNEANDLLKLTTTLTKNKDELTEALNQAKKLNKGTKELLDEVNKTKASVDADAVVTGAQRESIEQNQLDAEKHLNDLIEVTGKILEFEEKRDVIITKCDQNLTEATSRLYAASRAGMATSFSARTEEYIWPRRFWSGSFVFSLIGIFGVAYCFIIPEISELEGVSRFFHFITEFPLTLPFIWLAWFSALRFSQLGRLSEDYAFKVATVLSLYGYRKQADEVKPELEEKLLDLGITNFGENPLRLMTKDSAKDTYPLAGALDEKTLNDIVKSALKALSDKVYK